MKKDYPIFLSNAPKVNKQYKPFCNILNTKLKEKGNNNIGIIAAYGSGKSSAIKTFKKFVFRRYLFFKWRFINISLSSYLANENEVEISDTVVKINYKKMKEQELESAIIQQIVYSVPRYRIPTSSLRKHGIRFRSIALILFTFLIPFSCLSYYYDLFNKWFPRPDIASFSIYLGIISFLFLVALFLCFPITSISTKVKNIEIKSENFIQSTLFDEYIDELLYFFKHSKKNVVIFEDIDRCENCEELFSRLHTLNTTINNNLNGYIFKKNVRFIYCVKEDLFISSEQKSKFFDVSISINPVLTDDNKYDRLLDLLSEKEKEDLCITKFLDSVYKYIFYYRQLKNVINSYRFFSFHKNLTKKEARSLFTLMIYKSLFPDDYKDFISKQGFFAYLIFGSKHSAEGYEDSDFYKMLSYKDANNNKKISKAKISNFYLDFKDFIVPTSISLISSFVDSRYPSEDVRLFYENIDLRKTEIDFEQKYDNATNIICYKECNKYIREPVFLNYSLVKEIFSKHIKKPKLKEEFLNRFKEPTPEEIRFVKYLLEKMDESDSIVLFLKNVLAIMPDIISSFVPEQLESVLSYMCKNILTEKVFEQQDKESSLTLLLNKSDNQMDLLHSLNYKTLKLLLAKKFILKHFDIKYGFDEISRLVVNKLAFNPNVNNFMYIFIQNSNDECNSLFSVFNKIGESNLIEYLADSIDDTNFELYLPLFEHIKNEDVNLLSSSLSYFTKAGKLLASVSNNISVFIYKSTYLYEDNFILNMIKNKKIYSNLHDFERLLTIYKETPNISEMILDVVFSTTEMNSLISDDDKHNIPLLLYNVLNDNRCNYANAGKILEKCCETMSVSFAKITNLEAIRCAMDYKYLVLDQNLLSHYSSSYEEFTVVYGKYRHELNLLIKTLNLTDIQTSYILKYEMTNNDIEAINNFNSQTKLEPNQISLISEFLKANIDKLSNSLLVNYLTNGNLDYDLFFNCLYNVYTKLSDKEINECLNDYCKGKEFISRVNYEKNNIISIKNFKNVLEKAPFIKCTIYTKLLRLTIKVMNEIK